MVLLRANLKIFISDRLMAAKGEGGFHLSYALSRIQ